MNKGISPSLGINVSLFYTTRGFHIPDLHYEDSRIDSVHLIRSDGRNAEKIFLFMHHNDTERCIAEIVKCFATKEGRHGQLNLGCF